MKKRKLLKTLALLSALIMLISLGIFANALVGNPLSRMLAENSAKKHLAEKYPETDFYIDEVMFSFKDTSYYAKIKSPTSIDCDFSVNIDMLGHVVNDNYENLVLNGYNTSRRIDSEYRRMTKDVFSSEEFPYIHDMAYGRIEFTQLEYSAYEPDHWIVADELIIDGQYGRDEINTLAQQAGHLVLYIDDETVNIEKACEILLSVKRLMDEAGISFHDINLILQYPREISDDELTRPEGRIEVTEFLYTDIYENGLADRVAKADKQASEYHEMMDAQLKEDIRQQENIDTQ